MKKIKIQDWVAPQGSVDEEQIEKSGSTGRIWFTYDPENRTNGPTVSILPE